MGNERSDFSFLATVCCAAHSGRIADGSGSSLHEFDQGGRLVGRRACEPARSDSRAMVFRPLRFLVHLLSWREIADIGMYLVISAIVVAITERYRILVRQLREEEHYILGVVVQDRPRDTAKECECPHEPGLILWPVSDNDHEHRTGK
jgi:hypothetical protein